LEILAWAIIGAILLLILLPITFMSCGPLYIGRHTQFALRLEDGKILVDELGGAGRRLSLHIWLIIVLVAAACSLKYRCGQWKERKQSKRAAAGLCLNCGYDLRATPHRCPECGALKQ
jgi:hypothetical protein